MGKLVIDGNSVYELDEVCIRKKDDEERRHKENQERKEDKGRELWGWSTNINYKT